MTPGVWDGSSLDLRREVLLDVGRPVVLLDCPPGLFILARGFVSRVCGGVCGRQDALMMGVSMCAMLAGPALYLRAALVAAALLLFGSRAKPPRRPRLDA